MTLFGDELPPMPPYSEVLNRVRRFLAKDGNGFQVDEPTITPNVLQGLWIVSYVDASGGTLDGGALAVSDDRIWFISSDPTAEEYIGADFRDEDEDAADAEVEAMLSIYGDEDPEAAALVTLFHDNER